MYSDLKVAVHCSCRADAHTWSDVLRQFTDLTGWNSGAIQYPVCSALAMKTRRLPSSQRRIIVVRCWSDVLTEWRMATMSWVFALDDVALISWICKTMNQSLILIPTQCHWVHSINQSLLQPEMSHAEVFETGNLPSIVLKGESFYHPEPTPVNLHLWNVKWFYDNYINPTKTIWILINRWRFVCTNIWCGLIINTTGTPAVCVRQQTSPGCCGTSLHWQSAADCEFLLLPELLLKVTGNIFLTSFWFLPHGATNVFPTWK